MSVHFQSSPHRPVRCIDSSVRIRAEKVQALTGLAHEVFVQARRAWPLFEEARATAQGLASGPRMAYDGAVEALRLAATGDEGAWQRCRALLCPKATATRARAESLIQVLRASFPRRGDVLYHSRDRLWALSRQGGAEYDRALEAARWAAADKRARREVMELLFPDAGKKLAVTPVVRQ